MYILCVKEVNPFVGLQALEISPPSQEIQEPVLFHPPFTVLEKSVTRFFHSADAIKSSNLKHDNQNTAYLFL